MSTLTMYGISATYQKQSLDLIKSQDEINWNDYPVLINQIELNSMEFSRVVQVMQGTIRIPSAMASIQPADCPAVELIDREYNSAINFYKEKLREACSKDKQNIDILSKKLVFRRITDTVIGGVKWSGTFLAGALWRLPSLRTLPITRTSGLIGGFLLGCLLTAEFYKSYNKTSTDILRQGSSYRYQWLQLVNSEEGKRLGRIRDVIVKTCKKLISEISCLKDAHESDDLFINQLRQVYKLHEVIFNKKLLMSDDVDVQEFISKK